MKKFFIKIGLFAVVFCMILAVLIVSYASINHVTAADIPAPKIGNSYSLNEKLLFLKQKPKDALVLALGSSMSLNNLHSQTVIEELKSDKFINTSAWGMSVTDDYFFLKSLKKIYDIRELIIVTNLTDFAQKEKVVNYSTVENYLKTANASLLPSYTKNFNLDYYVTNLMENRKTRTNAYAYECLKYDDYGTVNLKKDSVRSEDQRWLSDWLELSPNEKEYMYLDSLSKFCKQSNIKLIVFQSPIREGLFSKLSQSKLAMLKSHIDKVAKILRNDNHVYVNSTDIVWADSLFKDGVHFNIDGARLFTKYCFEKAKQTYTVDFAYVKK